MEIGNRVYKNKGTKGGKRSTKGGKTDNDHITGKSGGGWPRTTKKKKRGLWGNNFVSDSEKKTLGQEKATGEGGVDKRFVKKKDVN